MDNNYRVYKLCKVMGEKIYVHEMRDGNLLFSRNIDNWYRFTMEEAMQILSEEGKSFKIEKVVG